MLRHQTGLSLITVAVVMAGVAALAMAALFSMRYERNLFAEGYNKVAGKPASAAVSLPDLTPTASSAPMRKCTIHGKTVVSNTECQERGKVIEIHDTKGIEAPKAPPPPPAESAPANVREKMIEKAAS